MKKKLLFLIVIPNILYLSVFCMFIIISNKIDKQVRVGDDADSISRSVRLLGDEFKELLHKRGNPNTWRNHWTALENDLQKLKVEEDTIGHNLLHELESSLKAMKKQFDMIMQDYDKYAHDDKPADRLVDPVVREAIDSAYKLSLAESEAVRLGNGYMNVMLLVSIGVIITITSITSVLISRSINAEIKTLEAMDKKLKSSNEDLSRFAYFLSHDLKEPARMVSSYITMVKDRAAGTLDEKMLTWLDFSADGAKRMESLIDSLLNYSRLDGKIDIKNVEICHEVLAIVLQDLQPAIKEAGAKIYFKCDNPVWERQASPEEECWHCKTKCDPVLMTRLFQNLICNAIKYAKPGVPPIINIRAEHKDHEIIFSIRDNGIGIREDDIPNLFQIFKRLHPRDMYPGNGIGLASCKKVVDRHGGKIWVDSQWGVVSIFYFSIPN
jgi:signal transduction histidine kinase